VRAAAGYFQAGELHVVGASVEQHGGAVGEGLNNHEIRAAIQVKVGRGYKSQHALATDGARNLSEMTSSSLSPRSFRIRTSVVFAGAFDPVPCLIAAIAEVRPTRGIQTPLWFALIVSFRQSIFHRDCKKCVAKPRLVVRVPKEGMVGVGAHRRGQARIRKIGKSKVRWSRFYRIQQAEYIQADYVNTLHALLDRQQFVQRLVGCRARCRGKTYLPRRRRQQTHVEQIGNHEMARASPPEQQFAKRLSVQSAWKRELLTVHIAGATTPALWTNTA
jgi:hypothetical protein